MSDSVSAQYAAFLAEEGAMISALSGAMHETLIEMGEDVKGISWFSSRSDEYAAKFIEKYMC